MTGNKACRKQAERRQTNNHQGNRQINRYHKAQCAQDRQNTGKQLGKAHQQSIRESINIGNDAADQVSRRMHVQIGKRQCLDLSNCRISQITGNAENDSVITN